MAILVDLDTSVIVQGITGREGTIHTQKMLKYGTNIVAGITPGKGGEWAGKTPIFETVQTAVNATGANTSIIFVPPTHAADAIYEAIDAEIELIVCITEGLPLHDSIRVREYIRNTSSRLLGPNCPGLLVPGVINLGIIPPEVSITGTVGIASRSGTLAYEVSSMLSQAGIGQSTIVGIGGDPIIGTSFVDVLSLFEEDPQTEKVVLIGEIGGLLENEAASYISQHMTKPVVAYIAGKKLPANMQMGHAGAVIDINGTDAESKIEALRTAGVRVASTLAAIPELLIGLDLA